MSNDTPDADDIRLDEQLSTECANWVAEQLSEEFGGFIAAEVIDAVLEFEADIRIAGNDPGMDHASMAERLLERLAEEGAPTDQRWGVTPHLLMEILFWRTSSAGWQGARAASARTAGVRASGAGRDYSSRSEHSSSRMSRICASVAPSATASATVSATTSPAAAPPSTRAQARCAISCS